MKRLRSKSQVYLLFISSGVFMLSGYIVNIYLGRSLGPHDYGTYGIITSLMTVFSLIQLAGIPQAVSRDVARYPDRRDAILRTGMISQVILSTILTALFWLLATPIASLLSDDNLQRYIQLTSLVFLPNALFSLTLGYYNGVGNFMKQGLMNISQSIAKAILVISLSTQLHLSGVIYGFASAPLVSFIIFFKKIQLFGNRYPYKRMLLYAIPLILIALSATLQSSLDILFLKSLNGDSILVGFYAASQNISRIPFAIVNAMSVIIFPKIANMSYLNQINNSRLLIKQYTRYLLIILLPLTALISTTGSEVIQFIYGKDYMQGGIILSVLVLSYVPLTLFTFFSSILSAAGYAIRALIYGLIGIICSIGTYILLVPQYSATGAAIATGIGTMISSYLCYRYVKSLYKIEYSLLSILKLVLACSIATILLIVLPDKRELLIVWYLITTIIYGIMIVILKIIHDDEVKKIMSILKKT